MYCLCLTLLFSQFGQCSLCGLVAPAGAEQEVVEDWTPLDFFPRGQGHFAGCQAEMPMWALHGLWGGVADDEDYGCTQIMVQKWGSKEKSVSFSGFIWGCSFHQCRIPQGQGLILGRKRKILGRRRGEKNNVVVIHSAFIPADLFHWETDTENPRRIGIVKSWNCIADHHSAIRCCVHFHPTSVCSFSLYNET